MHVGVEKLSLNTWVKKISTPRSASNLKSAPPARSCSISPTGMPWMRSMTMTFCRVNGQ
jgi:hypothetical protein